jgi:hypothetical protein
MTIYETLSYIYLIRKAEHIGQGSRLLPLELLYRGFKPHFRLGKQKNLCGSGL